MNIKNVLIGSSFLASCLLMSSAAFAGSTSPCSVSTATGTGARFYVPSGGTGRYNILGWGNGTGGTSSTYSGLLEAAAGRCVIVAAATTSNSGSGSEIASAVNQAKSRYASRLRSPLTVCTSGHSQGGGGSFNAANRLGASNAQCVIAVQPDTVFTTRIYSPLASSVRAVCIFSTADTLAPAYPSNGPNCDRNATIYTQEMTSGTHFAPTSGTGGEPGRVQRAYIDRWLVNN